MSTGISKFFWYISFIVRIIGISYTGADPGFQARGRAHLKKLRRAEGGAKFFGVFRVKNHDFTPKNLIFSILGGHAPDAPPLVPPLDCASYPFVSYYYHGHWVYFGATYIVFRMLCGIFSASYPFVSYYYH